MLFDSIGYQDSSTAHTRTYTYVQKCVHDTYTYMHTHMPHVHTLTQTMDTPKNMYRCTQCTFAQCTHVHMHTHTHMNAYTHATCTHEHTPHIYNTYIYANNIRTSPHTCTHVCTCVYTHVHMCKHRPTIYIHTCTDAFFGYLFCTKYYTFTTDHRLEVPQKDSLCIHAFVTHLLSTYYVPHFEEYSLKCVS